MSDNENLPPAPSKQTSSVPLKKETVRVTLKAADAPPSVPSATVPMAPPVRPPIPGGPPIITAPTVPGRPIPAPAIPVRAAGPPPAGNPAPTVRLAGNPAAPARPGSPAPGALPASPGLPKTAGAPTIGLPKATMQLQPPSQPLGGVSPSKNDFQDNAEDDVEEESDTGLVKLLSGLGLVAALVVLALQLMAAGQWINGEWSQLFS